MTDAARERMCPDCGIPEVWCRSVSSNAAHCWRWDYERTRRLEEALKRLANPTHTPKTEEAALLQIEVEQIARAALDSAEGS